MLCTLYASVMNNNNLNKFNALQNYLFTNHPASVKVFYNNKSQLHLSHLDMSIFQ